jgi:hypothetical protein
MKALFLLTFTLVDSCRLCAQDDAGFHLVRHDPPITVHERWVTFPGKNPPVKAREVKSEFLVNASMYKILALIKSEQHISTWQKHVSKFKVYTQTDTTVWQEYSYHDIPWPVSDQDHFLTYELTEVEKAKELFITFRSVEDSRLAPVFEDVDRMELSGSWRLQQVSPQQVKVTYRIYSMPSHIPRIFTDPVIRSNLMSTIKALTKLAER